MSIRRRIVFGGVATWVYRVVAIGLNLVLLPVLIHNIGQEELGIWFLLAQTNAFVGLMDLGLGPTLTRRIAMSRGTSGGEADVKLTPESLRSIADLVTTSRIIYRALAAIVFVVVWVIGYFFLRQLELVEMDFSTVLIAWTVISLSHAATVLALLWPAVLQGLGLVGWDAVLGLIITTLTIGVEIAVVLFGGGLVALAVTAGAGAVVLRSSTLIVAKRRQPDLFEVRGRWDAALMRDLAGPAIRAWFTSLGAFLILKTDQYFIAYFRGADEIPAYHIAHQLLANLYTAAIAFAMASHPFISQLWQRGDLTGVHRILLRNVRLGLAIMLTGAGFVLAAGPSLFDLWLGAGNFIGYPVLIVFALMLTLETQHVIVAFASRATEDEAFAVWAMAAGALNLLFTWFLIQRLGLLGVALGTLFAQIATNNWYAVYRGLRRLQMPFLQYAYQVLAPTLGIGLTAAAALWTARSMTSGSDDLSRVLATLSAALLVLVVSVWTVVLDGEERRASLLQFRRAISPAAQRGKGGEK